MRPPNDRPPANSGRSGASRIASAAAARTAACAIPAVGPLRALLHVGELVAQGRDPALREPLRVGPCWGGSSRARAVREDVERLRIHRAEQQRRNAPSPTGMRKLSISGGGALGLHVPPRGQLARGFDVGREIDLAPLLALDVERPNLALCAR